MWDVNAPASLKEVQSWFAKIITIPIKEDNKLFPITPWQTSIEEEAKLYIAPSPSLAPHERIELYHQQYWWRLLETLQENFPALTRLYGYATFNLEIGIPYLTANPPTNYALCTIGDKLPSWLEKNLKRSQEKSIVCQIALLDWAFNEAFFIPEKTPITDITLTPLTLQPHIHLFALDSDLLSFREEFLKESVDHYASNPFPPLQKTPCTYVLFRSHTNHVAWEKISPTTHLLLTHLKNGATLEEACQALPDSPEVEESLSFWFYTFAKRNWLTSFT